METLFIVTEFWMRSHCALHHTYETDTGKTMRIFYTGGRKGTQMSLVWFLIISTLQLMLLDMRSMLVEILDTGPLTRAARRRE